MKHQKIFAVTILALLGTWSYAHGPKLEVDKTSAGPGEQIKVSGEGITTNGEVQLVLQGVLADHPLGIFQGDAHGRFEAELMLPLDIEPGKYTLIASGDQRATARLEIRPATAEENAHSAAEHPEEPEGHAGHSAHEDAAEPHARADALKIQRSTGGLDGCAWLRSAWAGPPGFRPRKLKRWQVLSHFRRCSSCSCGVYSFLCGPFGPGLHQPGRILTAYAISTLFDGSSHASPPSVRLNW